MQFVAMVALLFAGMTAAIPQGNNFQVDAAPPSCSDADAASIGCNLSNNVCFLDAQNQPQCLSKQFLKRCQGDGDCDAGNACLLPPNVLRGFCVPSQ